MKFPRWIGVVVLVVAVGVVVGPGAARTEGVAKADFSTRHGVEAYLRSLGQNPARFVIQRGARNYAGAHCPGKGWNCTKSTRVVQIATSGATANVADCGTDPICVVTQTSTSGGNTFTCNQQTATVDGLQKCIIIQKTGTVKKTVNKNKAFVTQVINQTGASGTQTANQIAQVSQNNDSGPNEVTISQSINQSFNDSTQTSISQSQSATQSFAVAQCAQSQAFQDSSDGGFPSCNTANPPLMKGSASSTVTQNVQQSANANAATSGSQFQESTMTGHVHQWANSSASSSVSQTENQNLYALGTDVLQTQKGPMGVTPSKHKGTKFSSRGRALAGGQGCCSNQGDNPSDTFSVSQSSSQQASNTAAIQTSGTNWHADELQTATCDVSGSCTRTQNNTPASGNGTSRHFCSKTTCSDGQNLDTDVSYTGETLSVADGAITLAAHLDRQDAGHVDEPLSAQDVTFTIDDETSPRCTRRTPADGNVSCTLALGPGSYTIHTSFAGAGPFEPDSVDSTLIVYGYLNQGAFVIAANTATVGNAVTFFSVKNWPASNPLVPAAPNGFQGFADTLNGWTPPACPSPPESGTWTLNGNVAPPSVASVPAYMAILATTSVSKTGSTFTGNETNIVVVRTDSYSTGPNGKGTGGVVAVVC